MKILIADAFDAKLPERLAVFGEVFSDPGRLAEADVVLVRSKTKVTKEYLEKAPNLKLVIRGGVGLDNVDKAACANRGIEVKNTPQASSIAVAELAMALMLAVPNHIVAAHNGMTEGKFLKSELKRTELYKKTLGLVGIGMIGTEVAKRAAAFGMEVIASDPYLKEHPIARLVSFEELLAQADYISFHTPLTDETKGMFNKDVFAKMKDGVILVNTGRGKVIVEQDLADALVAGKVRAYATDVWYSDPPPADCPLLSAPNVLMTPHIGASSKENLGRIGDVVVEILSKRVGS
ncbi:hydroxyacid dehydrogenase [Myxococcota bacterium]|jgi:D-3-phosphoglycerate dehydrogenase|nr:hydroxyacid dehydrogenase [Myxococcota bacterium]MBP8971983.1 hydroxyacid dehydrogenase [Myxococcota bacterium]OQC42190.1 MAG: D-3-phosphoglycerate dehydrogenase [Deltaproteobacteria bacterium ADurb.Bin058]HHW97082.1 hydroxyacid dehydrogenase [Oligoflexales bacterium]